MTEPAALSATYSDFKLIKTRSVISLSFDLAIYLPIALIAYRTPKG